MKRLIFCFDGTWNKLANIPTNVVLTAASIKRKASDGTAQIIYYDEGVGTAWYDKLVGGGFGWGLIENVRKAYRFLIFNYDPGDQIYVFGFSRGAFTARSFIGLMRYIGPIRRLFADRIDEALNLYHQRVKETDGASEAIEQFRAKYASDVCISQTDDDWRTANIAGYVKGSAPVMKVKYLGVWDTVAALGVPEVLPGSTQMNVNNRFHDPSINDFIDSARHAVATDERRVLFPPVLFGDLTALNKAKGFAADDEKAPFQERWFPGVHGSVGGGGDIRGLSDGTLAWILNGAKLGGLELDTAEGSRIQAIEPNPLAPLVNSHSPSTNPLYRWAKDRSGPDKEYQLSKAAIRRWKATADKIPEKTLYRPKTLSRLQDQLNSSCSDRESAPVELLESYVVQQGDTLTALAYRFYGHADKSSEIYNANRDTLDSPDDLFIGWVLRIPKLSPPGESE